MNIRSVTEGDVESVIHLLSEVSEFNDRERSCCLECARDFLFRGSADRFICVEDAGEVLGVACYGADLIADDLTEVYWIAVSTRHRREGVGRAILSHIEGQAAAAGARMIVIDTESSSLYEKTRRFYEGCGYVEASRITDFYRVGNDKVIYVKQMSHVGFAGFTALADPAPAR